VHRYADDPWIAPTDVTALGAAVEASGAPFEDHVAPGRGHLFTDPDLPGYDAALTAATVERVDGFIR
jgi:dienelactone hydrolase